MKTGRAIRLVIYRDCAESAALWEVVERLVSKMRLGTKYADGIGRVFDRHLPRWRVMSSEFRKAPPDS